MNKKGDFDIAQFSVYMIYAALFLGAVAIVFVLSINALNTAPLVVNDNVYVDTYTERFLSNPDCFAYVDPATNVVYPDVIDIQKFTSDRLDACYVPNTALPYEFFLTLQYQGTELKARTYNFRVLSSQFPIYVLVQNGANRVPATLLIGVGGLNG